MNLADELEKLEQLRQNDVLDNSEFARAKALILNQTGLQSDDLKKLNRESELARLDREWQLEQQKFMVTGRYGIQRIPSIGGVIGAVLTSVFGIIWTFAALSMFSGFAASTFTGTSQPFPFNIFRFIFPTVGIGLTIFFLWSAMDEYKKLTAFEKAQLQYQQKRLSMT